MTEYLSPKWQTFLKNKGFSTFTSLWDREDEWFERPNEGRSKDGWSGVCKIDIDGKSFFLKKQENFFAYSIRHPFGISVAEREFNNLKLFNELDVPCMHVVYFGVRKNNGKLQGMIMTEDLKDYLPLDKVEELWEKKPPELSLRRNVIEKLALLVRDAHKKGVMHFSLYPKHVFFSKSLILENKESEEPCCRFIDMEKAVKARWGSKKQLRDLETLSRRSKNWTKQDRVHFLKCYLQKEKFDSEVRDLFRKIQLITKN